MLWTISRTAATLCHLRSFAPRMAVYPQIISLIEQSDYRSSRVFKEEHAMQSNIAQLLGARCISKIGFALAIVCFLAAPLAGQTQQPGRQKSMADELKVSRTHSLPRATTAGPITSRRQQNAAPKEAAHRC